MNIKSDIVGNKCLFKRSLVLVCLIILVNSIVLSVIAQSEFMIQPDYLKDTGTDNDLYGIETELNTFTDLDIFIPDVFNQYYPISSRQTEIVGTVIGPGNYTGSVDPISNPYEIYTIPLNGSIANTDIINISFETSSSSVMAFVTIANPDMFVMDVNILTSVSTVYMEKYAITSDYHYIAVANPFMGTVDYWMNVTTTPTANPQNDGDNDFGNATQANDDDNIQDSLNATYDYWDNYKLTIPTEHNVTITCEVTGNIDIALELYSTNSSMENLLASADEGWDGEDEILYYDSNVTQIDGYLHVYCFPYTPQGNYWLNFSIKPLNLNSRPSINMSDPKLNLWTSSSGLAMNEDEVSENEIILSEHFRDDGKPPTPGALSYDYISDNENITVVIHGNSSVTITPAPNWFGNAVINFFANDSVFEVSDELNITVNSVNDPPVLELADNWMETENNTATPVDTMNFTVAQGGLVELTVNASDIDGDALTFSIDEFNLTGIAATADPFTIEAESGKITFTPTNDYVGIFSFILNVTDDEAWITHEFGFTVTDVNDEPMITKIWVGTNSVMITDNTLKLTGTLAATEDEKFNFTLEGMDIDINADLDYTIESGVAGITSAKVDAMKTNFSFTPTNSDSLVGYVNVNISVSDDTTPDDYVLLNISVIGANDAPTFTKIAGMNPEASKYKDMGKMKEGEYSNFTMEGADIDGDTLTLVADSNKVTITKVGDGKWNVSFHPTEAVNVTVNITLNDGEETDYYNFFWVVESVTPPPPPNNPPTITITTEDGKEYKLGDIIVIEGSTSDPDEGDTVVVKVEVVMPRGTKSGIYDDIPLTQGILDDYWITYNADGTWKFQYETTDTILSSLDELYEGTYTFYFIAVDSHDAESDSASITAKAEGDDDDDVDVGLLFGLGLALCLVVILIPVIIIIIVVVLLLRRRKAKAEPIPPPMEGMAPPPAEMTCPACGATVPTGAQTCPSCGAAVPPPPAEGEAPPMEEAPPAAEQACPACGAMIPAGYPTCPACGAEAPPMEEAPPAAEQACPACGAGLPEGSPTCPACGAEAPPPAEEPLAEQPAAEGMATCPGCGGQLAVGQTPCPSCGMQLNW